LSSPIQYFKFLSNCGARCIGLQLRVPACGIAETNACFLYYVLQTSEGKVAAAARRFVHLEMDVNYKTANEKEFTLKANIKK
jgi:hypothetical protein